MNLQDARTRFLEDQSMKAANTIATYRVAIDHFLLFLDDVEALGKAASRWDTQDFTKDHVRLFWDFAAYLHEEGYKRSTIHHRTIVIRVWFGWLNDNELLGDTFNLDQAKRILRSNLGKKSPDRAPRPPERIESVIAYYDHQDPPAYLQRRGKNAFHLWALARLRNAALLKALANSGGRISEVLSLDVDDFPQHYLDNPDAVLKIPVHGKGGVYDLWFSHDLPLMCANALPAIARYIKARGPDGFAPLFISHHKPYTGNRVSRVTGWRIVNQAAKALGIERIKPHDFRHFVATELLNSDVPPDVVQEFLGHKSIETTRNFYAHTKAERIEEILRGDAQ